MRRWLLGSALLGACSGGSALETTSAYTTLAPTGEGDGDTESTGDTEATNDSTSGSDPSTTGAGDTDPGTSSTGAAESSSSGEQLPPPPQPEDGWWSHCILAGACTESLLCFVNGAGDDGFCTNVCEPAGNTASCGLSPGGTATPTCLALGSSSVCALDCSGGKTCPGGMLCLSDMADSGPIEICI